MQFWHQITKFQRSAVLKHVLKSKDTSCSQAELAEMPEGTLAAAQHTAELFLAARSVANAAPQCQLSLQQYHVMLAAALAATPAR